MNDWSFSQLCRLAEVAKDTINRLSPETAARALAETLPARGRPTQVLTEGARRPLDPRDELHAALERRPPVDGPRVRGRLRAAAQGVQRRHGALLRRAGHVRLPHRRRPAGQRSRGEAFAPGFFVWNSEVGRRTLGISTFWFQPVCQNHIVWDATEVVEFTAKHTAKVAESLSEMRRILERLVDRGGTPGGTASRGHRPGDGGEARRRRRGGAEGRSDGNGIPQGIGRQAVKLIEGKGRFTIFALVDALTRIAREIPNAGDRTELDQKAAGLLKLVEN